MVPGDPHRCLCVVLGLRVETLSTLKNYSYLLTDKTKTDRYKEHWAVLAGNELYCYRQKGDTEHRVMHSMIGTFIKDMPSEFSQSEDSDLHPVKIVLPPNKSRILYFKQKAAQ